MIATRGATKPASRDFLRQYELIRPENAGSRWRGIHHGDAVDTLERTLTSRGIEIVGEEWNMSGKENAIMAGKFDVRLPDVPAPDGMEHSIGMISGNNLRKALTIVFGGKVFVCCNGMVVGEFSFRKMHTLNFDMVSEFSRAVNELDTHARSLHANIDALKSIEMTDAVSDRALMEAGRSGLMAWSRIGQVDREYRRPTFSDFKEKNAWSLYNAFTYTAQKQPPHEQPASIRGFGEILRRPLEITA